MSLSPWRQALTLARHELLVERRGGDALTILLPFGAVALMALPLALGLDLPLIARVGPAAFWVISLLFGMQVTLRPGAPGDRAQEDLLALLGVDPAARFVGRALAGGVLTGLVVAALAVVMVLLYSPAGLPGWPGLLLTGSLFAAGLAELGVVVSSLTTGLRSRSALAPLLAAPLAIPLLIGAAGAQESLARGLGILPWATMLVLADLLLAVTGVLTARPLEEAAE